ncbi:hypothetical protein ACOZ4N_00565 (plasmid) [Halorientalis pallida]|uniref:hypothetical protein n=1 Tax=Halorientalis pallida TaxID=2479928 RepID=UPI003C6F9450
MDQSDFDLDTNGESDITLDDLMEAVDAVLAQYDSSSGAVPDTDATDEVYTVRVGSPEKEFIDDLGAALTTNRAETLRLTINLAAAHLKEIQASTGDLEAIDAELTQVRETLRKFDEQLATVDDISAQLDRIEDRLDRDQQERTTSTEQEQTPAEQTDWDAIDPDEFEHPGEGVEVDLPDPDDLD